MSRGGEDGSVGQGGGHLLERDDGLTKDEAGHCGHVLGPVQSTQLQPVRMDDHRVTPATATVAVTDDR